MNNLKNIEDPGIFHLHQYQLMTSVLKILAHLIPGSQKKKYLKQNLLRTPTIESFPSLIRMLQKI